MTRSGPAVVEVLRGEVVESRHRAHVAVSDASGRMRGWAGDPELVTFYRSAAKPFQALPLVEEGVADGLGMPPEEVALCCASHEGEAPHVSGARSILRRVGRDEAALRCGPHPPFSGEAARALAAAGEAPGAIHNNCSGKHAGMVAFAVAQGWDPAEYHRPDHPVQRRMKAEVSRWSEVPEAGIGMGVDGCGIPCFAVPLTSMAASFARFAAAAARGEGAADIVEAMTAHPFMVAGTGRACTRVMERTGPRAFVKLGAEGVYGGGVPAQGLGLAIKVEDGSRRAVESVLVAVLEQLGVLDADDVGALASFHAPTVTNTRGEAVGSIRTRVTLADA